MKQAETMGPQQGAKVASFVLYAKSACGLRRCVCHGTEPTRRQRQHAHRRSIGGTWTYLQTLTVCKVLGGDSVLPQQFNLHRTCSY